MAQVTASNEEGFIERAILNAARKRAAEIIQEELEKTETKIRARLVAVADEIALSVMTEYSFERIGPELRITVKKPEQPQ